MSNNNFNINERGTLYSRDSLGQEKNGDTLDGECLCGASGGIMDGECTCESAGGFAGGNDEIDGGAEFDLNVGYFGGDVDNLSDDECSDTSSDTSSDCSSSDDEDADNVGGGFDGDFGGGEFDAIVGTYLGGSYIGASDLEIGDDGEKSFFGTTLDSAIGDASPKIETTTSEPTELTKRSFSPDPETSRPESPVSSVSPPASPVGSVSSVGSNASGTFMDRRGNKKSQSPTNTPTNTPTNSPLITTDDFGIVLSGVHKETPEETSITEQSDLIEHITNETTNETDDPVTEQSDLIEDTTESKPITEKPESDDEEPESDDEKPKKTGGRLDNVDGGTMNDALIEFLGKVGSI